MDSQEGAPYIAVMDETHDMPAPQKVLTPAARRALAEADARRKAAEAQADAAAPEQGGPSGPEPTRFGDWERKGLAVDF